MSADVSEQTGVSSEQTCPSCGETGTTGAQWCEACGASLDPVAASASDADGLGSLVGPACVDCGAEHHHIVDGYCGQCGRKQPGVRDHLAEEAGNVVAVTDRGKRHHHNEDAFAIGHSGDRLIAVVCDGVSTTDHPEEASLAAAEAARDHLRAALDGGADDYAAALVDSVRAAQEAASSVPHVDGGRGPASTTFVATVVVPDPAGEIVRTWTAWLGDSRAYWVQPNEQGPPVVTQLTTDDSWGLHQVALGEMSEDEAMADPRAQSIIRWLGADAGDVVPNVQAYEHDPGGWLLSCSDGLWKYAATEESLAALLDENSGERGVARDVALQSPLELAEALVAFANDRGGHDNTTIAIAMPEMGKD